MGAVFDQVWEIVAVCVLVAIVLVAAVVGLVRGRSSRQKELTPPPAPPKPSTTTAPPTDLDTDTEPGRTGTLQAPPPTAPPEPDVDDVLVEELPTLERPASARGRLARLRARLARSNTAIGNALLGLLSRGGLDEEAWEEVEDILIGPTSASRRRVSWWTGCAPRSGSTGLVRPTRRRSRPGSRRTCSSSWGRPWIAGSRRRGSTAGRP
jgi:hypothetical protein